MKEFIFEHNDKKVLTGANAGSVSFVMKTKPPDPFTVIDVFVEIDESSVSATSDLFFAVEVTGYFYERVSRYTVPMVTIVIYDGKSSWCRACDARKTNVHRYFFEDRQMTKSINLYRRDKNMIDRAIRRFLNKERHS